MGRFDYDSNGVGNVPNDLPAHLPARHVFVDIVIPPIVPRPINQLIPSDNPDMHYSCPLYKAVGVQRCPPANIIVNFKTQGPVYTWNWTWIWYIRNEFIMLQKKIIFGS